MRKIAFCQPLEIFQRLFVRGIKVAASGFVLRDQGAAPEEVDETAASAPFLKALSRTLNRLLKTRQPSAGHAENSKELIPKGLSLGTFGTFTFPLPGEGKRAVFDFIQ